MKLRKSGTNTAGTAEQLIRDVIDDCAVANTLRPLGYSATPDNKKQKMKYRTSKSAHRQYGGVQGQARLKIRLSSPKMCIDGSNSRLLFLFREYQVLPVISAPTSRVDSSVIVNLGVVT